LKLESTYLELLALVFQVHHKDLHLLVPDLQRLQLDLVVLDVLSQRGLLRK